MDSNQEIEINHLKEEVQKLNRRIDEENNKRLKKYAGILAVIAATFAVPQGIVTLYSSIASQFAKPNTSLYPGNALTVSYSAKQKTIKFDFELAIVNNGSKIDVIRDVNAHLDALSSSLSPIYFSLSDFKLSDGGVVSVSLPLNIKEERKLSCSVSSQLEQASQATLDHLGMKRLTVELKGENNQSYKVDFCFRVTESEVIEVFESGQPRRFLYPECNNR